MKGSKRTPGGAWRVGWLALAAGAAGALLVSQAVAWPSLQGAIDAAHRSEAEVLLARFREAMREEGDPETHVAAFVESQAAAGVTYAAAALPRQTVAAGAPLGRAALHPDPGEAAVIADGEHVRVR
ncbi:MAG: hypothetical protein AAGH15_23340, partial [Myxococcota bacterium]